MLPLLAMVDNSFDLYAKVPCTASFSTTDKNGTASYRSTHFKHPVRHLHNLTLRNRGNVHETHMRRTVANQDRALSTWRPLHPRTSPQNEVMVCTPPVFSYVHVLTNQIATNKRHVKLTFTW